MPSDAQRRHFVRNLAKYGERSLRRSRSSLARRLDEHRRELEQIRSTGGYTSYVDGEIKNFESQIEAIDEILGAP